MDSIFTFLMRRGKVPGKRILYDESELRFLYEALRSQNLFALDGQMVKQFEQEFAALYGVPHAVASTSGTAAIHTAIGALDLDAGDEIITAPVTDLGTIIPILNQNCIPVFADVDASMQMDANSIESKITARTRAILVVHLFGNTCDMDAVMAVAKKHNLPVIEDCSQTHLTEYKGRFVGTIGDLGCFSFQQSKHMTTGDGGMTITSNTAYADRMKLFVDKGYARKGWGARAYLFHAPNYRMNELTGAVGRAQLKKVATVVEKRRKMGARMTELLKGVPGVEPLASTPGAEPSYWLYAFHLQGTDVTAFCKDMIGRGVYAMAGYTGKPIYLCTESLSAKKTYGKSELPFSWRKDATFEYREGLCPKAEKALETLVCVPWHEGWGVEGVEKAAKVVRESLEKVSGVSLQGGASASDACLPAGRKQSMPAPKIASGTSSPRNDHQAKLRVALIGCGQIGRWHLDAYKKQSDCVIAAVCDTDGARARQFAEETGAHAYTSHKEMLAAEKLDAASICTVPSTHREIALDLLGAGVHVLCEKPLAISVVDAEEMVSRARQKKKQILTAYKLRFAEEIQRTKEILDRGLLGKVLTFRLIFGGYMDMADTWYSKKELSGGGALMDNGPHALDLVRHLFGDPSSVRARLTHSQGLGVEDTVKIDVELAGGASGTLDISWAAYVTPETYLEIYGDQGAVYVSWSVVKYRLKAWKEWKTLANKEGAEGSFTRQVAHFIGAVRTGSPTVVDDEAGLAGVRGIEAIYQKEIG